MYEFKILSAKKVLVIDVKGIVDYNETERIIGDFQKKMSEIRPSEYSLVLSGKEVKPASLMVLPNIQRFIMLCYNTPFKKFYFVGNDMQNSYAKSMIMANNNLGKDIKLVGSIDDALKQL